MGRYDKEYSSEEKPRIGVGRRLFLGILGLFIALPMLLILSRCDFSQGEEEREVVPVISSATIDNQRVEVSGEALDNTPITLIWPDQRRETFTHQTGSWQVIQAHSAFSIGQVVQAQLLNKNGNTVTLSAALRAATLPVKNIPHSGSNGQQCFAENNEMLVDCNSESARALNTDQDGMRIEENTMHYSLVPKAGGGEYAKNECVKDNVTGLYWEGKGGSPIRAGKKTYSNVGDKRNGDASLYIEMVNNTRLCGFDNWRLPSVTELQTLIDYAQSAPAINRDWFPNTIANNHWTATPYTASYDHQWMQESTWSVDFEGGGIRNVPRGGEAFIRLVRHEIK